MFGAHALPILCLVGFLYMALEATRHFRSLDGVILYHLAHRVPLPFGLIMLRLLWAVAVIVAFSLAVMVVVTLLPSPQDASTAS